MVLEPFQQELGPKLVVSHWSIFSGEHLITAIFLGPKAPLPSIDVASIFEYHQRT